MDWRIALAALALPAPSAAKETAVTVARGEEVVATLAGDNGGEVTLVSRAASSPLPYEIVVGEQLRGDAFADAIGAKSAPVGTHEAAMPPPIEPDQLRLRLMPVAGTPEGTLLLVQNGYTRALSYRARITFAGGSAPTDVCLVIPRFGSVEFWPQPLSSITLGSFRLQDWNSGENVPCG